MPFFTAKQKVWIASRLYRVIALARFVTGRSPETIVQRRGLRWHLDLREGIDLSIYVLGAFEPATLRAYTRLIKPGDIVFDIGANIGAHTLHFALLAGPAGRVYAFEPTDFAFGKLQRNLALNPALPSRVTAVQTFLVDRPEAAMPASVSSSWPIDVAANASANDHGGEPQTLVGASALTADQFCHQNGVDRIDLVKIDVDGHELTVLKGFQEILRRLKPKILIELAPFVHPKPGEFESLVALLANIGYDFYDEHGTTKLSSEPKKLVALIPHGAALNALLIPRPRVTS